jgi:hypothetical protein
MARASHHPSLGNQVGLRRKGDDGMSAYDIAVRDGYVGTINQWLDSLKGETGSDATVTKANVEAVLIGQITTHTHDMTGKVDKIMNYSLVPDTEIAKIHASGSDNQDLSNLQPKETGKGLSTEDFTTADMSKLDGIEPLANNYVHPASHAPSIITQDVSNRFVTDTEKGTWNGKQDALGFTAEDVSNKENATLDNSITRYPTNHLVKEYVDGSVAGLLNLRGGWDASSNTYPSTGGSGTAGAIMKGDLWIISVQGTLNGEVATVGSQVFALVNTPGQTNGNWEVIINTVLSFTPEDVANKVVAITGASTDVQYPSAKLLYDQLVLKQDTEVGKGLSTNDYTAAEKAKLGGMSIVQTEIDFGTSPTESADFTISDANVVTTTNIMVQLAYVAPTGKSLDELEFDSFDFRSVAGTGDFVLHARSLEGYVADKFKINYSICNP